MRYIVDLYVDSELADVKLQRGPGKVDCIYDGLSDVPRGVEVEINECCGITQDWASVRFYEGTEDHRDRFELIFGSGAIHWKSKDEYDMIVVVRPAGA